MIKLSFHAVEKLHPSLLASGCKAHLHPAAARKMSAKLNYCFSLLSPQKQSKFLLTNCLKLMTTGKDSNYDKLSMFDCLSTLEIDKYIRKTQGIPWRRRICMPSCTGCLSSIIAGSIAVCMTWEKCKGLSMVRQYIGHSINTDRLVTSV